MLGLYRLSERLVSEQPRIGKRSSGQQWKRRLKLLVVEEASTSAEASIAEAEAALYVLDGTVQFFTGTDQFVSVR